MSAPALSHAAQRQRRRWLWGILVSLLLVAQSLLVWLTMAFESNRQQDLVDAVAAETAAEVKRRMGLLVQTLQALTWDEEGAQAAWEGRAREAMRQQAEVARVERRDARRGLIDAVDSPLLAPLFAHWPRASLAYEADAACAAAARQSAPVFSATYFVPLPEGAGREVIELCLPPGKAAPGAGYVVATLMLGQVLELSLSASHAQQHEMSFVESDGARLVRAGVPRALGIYRSERVVDLPGRSLQLRVDSTKGRPSLIPNLPVALVGGLSLAVLTLVAVLARDVRRRALAEAALAESLAFRKAMEDSLVTGLRARDLRGRITYVNPAFCAMVGRSSEELLATVAATLAQPGQAHAHAQTRSSSLLTAELGQPVTLLPVQPYWPPELVAEYQQRQIRRMSLPPDGDGVAAAREGIETVFMRRSGERFPVMIYEAPLVDGQGAHTGWMSTVLDVTAQREAEEQSRVQQERLQASARLATMGEVASLLSHELNQPLAAIASYAGAAQNWVKAPDAADPDLLQQALQRITEQAERAGRIIKSVHSFVRRREQHHEPVSVDQLIDAVMPLMRLQARVSATRIECHWPNRPPVVRCDRTLVEQLVLNLTRNAIQSMEAVTPERRLLSLHVRPDGERRVAFEVIDQGCGIAAETAKRLFTPFFSTRSDGMGLGLSLCRTVVEQHGGTLEFQSPWPLHAQGGCRFLFTLPAATPAASTRSSAQAAPAAHAERG